MALDSRVIEVDIQFKGQTVKTFKNLYISASGAKLSNGIQNEVNIKIANLSREDRDFVLSEISPYNNKRVDKKVILRAGRQSTGIQQIFVGDLIRGSLSQPPDSMLDLKAKTSNFFKQSIVSNSLGPINSLSEIAGVVAADLNLSLRFEAEDKNIKNFAFTGGALNQVDILGEAGGVSAYVDDQVLIVKDYNVLLDGSISVLSKDSGMIGIPTMDIQGITVRYLMDRTSTLGGALRINSEIYPATNGTYNIYKLDFDIANRETPWYWIAQAKRQDTQ